MPVRSPRQLLSPVAPGPHPFLNVMIRTSPLSSMPIVEESPCLPSVEAENAGSAHAGERLNVHVQEERRLAQERERTAALMRLPPIEMKKFGGDVTEFAQFIKSFELDPRQWRGGGWCKTPMSFSRMAAEPLGGSR